MAEKRKRRTAEQARNEILDAAEKRLQEVGPAGIRLQDIASDVGISHPAVLHHFGSREALIEAVITRAMAQLQEELIGAVGTQPVGEQAAIDMLERVFRVLSERGYGRIMAWMLLSGHPAAKQEQLGAVARVVHARRLEEHRARGTKPALEDTLFLMLMAALAMFGDAIAGPVMRQSAGVPERSARRFRRWFAKLLLAHLDRAPTE